MDFLSSQSVLGFFGEGLAPVFLDGGVYCQGQCPELVVVCAWGMVVVDLAVWHELVRGGV